MITTLVLMTVERNKINQIAEQLVEIDGVSEVYSVAGRYDLAAIVRVKNNDDLSDVVADHMCQVEGITSSETLITFRVFSKHDLERMFSIGMESE